MKLPICSLMLLMLSGPAQAGWELVRSTPGAVSVYIERETLERSGNLARIWSLFDLATAEQSPNGMSFLSTRSRTEFDCSNNTRRMLAVDFHESAMGTGRIVSTRKFGEMQSRFDPVAHNSLAADVMKVACGGAKTQ
jgi:hypothetical protein